MLQPYLTVGDLSELLSCNRDTARDRIQQIDFYFYLLDQPQKRALHDGRSLKITEDSMTEFLSATENTFFDSKKWREPITELVNETKGQ